MRSESVDCTPPDFIMPAVKDRPLTALHVQNKDQKSPQCIKVIIVLVLTSLLCYGIFIIIH